MKKRTRVRLASLALAGGLLGAAAVPAQASGAFYYYSNSSPLYAAWNTEQDYASTYDVYHRCYSVSARHVYMDHGVLRLSASVTKRGYARDESAAELSYGIWRGNGCP